MANHLIPWRTAGDDVQPWFADLERTLWGRFPSPPGLGWAPWREWGPAVDVAETENEIIVRAEVPGVRPEDIDITVSEDAVTVRGEVKQEFDASHHGYRRIERRTGSFARTVPLPVKVRHEEAQADYRNGILEVRVPKAEPGRGRSTRLRLKGDTGPQP